MIFKSKQIKGHGRGEKIGFPTINLAIPSDLVLNNGIYAVWVVIDNVTFKGALHFGPIPTFDEKDQNLEVYLLDITRDNVPETEDKDIEVDIVEYVREIKKFLSVEDLSIQIDSDVKRIREVLA